MEIIIKNISLSIDHSRKGIVRFSFSCSKPVIVNKGQSFPPKVLQSTCCRK